MRQTAVAACETRVYSFASCDKIHARQWGVRGRGAVRVPDHMALHEGWAILHFRDRPPLAGRLRYEVIGDTDRWSLDVPTTQDHAGYVAILRPGSIHAVLPCDESEALMFMSGAPAAQQKARHARHNPPRAGMWGPADQRSP